MIHMTEFHTSRREVLAAGTLLAGMSAMAGKAIAEPVATPAASFTPDPLPFPPASLGWLSEKLITSHHDNNYVGAVKRLGAIRGEFAKLDMATAPSFRS